MPRNSDMVRSGQAAIPDPETRAQTPHASTVVSDEASFSSIPNIQQPPAREIKNFPVFSQLFNEIGTIAEVVDQINRISDFISGRPVQPIAQQPAHQTQQPIPQTRQQPVSQPQQTAPTPQVQYPRQEEPAPAPPKDMPITPAPVQPAPTPIADEAAVQELYSNLYQFVEEIM